eukprot:352355-Chlamydomonas_euryale.AAC.2
MKCPSVSPPPRRTYTHTPRSAQIVGRRKKRRSFEYEIAWVGLSSICYNKWVTREELVERGFEKLVNEYDGKLASEQK